MNWNESYKKYLEIICKEAELLVKQWVLETIVKHYRYIHYRDEEFNAVSSHTDWDGWWPVIDENGDLTGRISEGGKGYLVTADHQAVISEADAVRAGADVCDGVATLID